MCLIIIILLYTHTPGVTCSFKDEEVNGVAKKILSLLVMHEITLDEGKEFSGNSLKF